MDYTGTGNTLNPVHPSVLRLIMDSLRYFVIEMPRRRLPLRPRLGARARVLRGRPPVGLLRHHPPGPGALPGEADRRAVGRRRGGYQVGNFPSSGPSGTGSTATRCATSGAARPASATSRSASPARATSTSTTAAGRSRRSTSSPRTTASRCATSSRTTRSTTRRTSRTTATARTTTAAGTAASRGRPTTRRSSSCARAPDAELPDHAVPLPGRADAARRRRDRAHAARQQQRVLPGQRALLVRLGPRRAAQRLLEFTKRLIEFRARIRCSSAPTSSPARSDRVGLAGRLVVPAGRAQDDAMRELAPRRDTHTLGVFLNGAEIPTVTRRRAGIDDTFLILFNAQPEAVAFTLPARRFGRRWALELSTAEPDAEPGRRPSPRAASCPSRAGRSSSCAGSPRCGELPLHVPAAAGAPPRLPTRRAALVPYLRDLGVSHLYLSPSLRPARARRTGTTSSTRRGSRTTSAVRTSSARSAAAPGSASCSTSSRTTWRRRGREPVLARPALAREVLRPRLAHRLHRRFFDVGELAGVRMEDPRSGEHAREGARARARTGSSTGCGSTIPTGSPTRAGTSSGCARRRRARLGREDPRAGRAAARLAGRGDDRLRVPERRRRRSSSTRPARSR